MLNFLSELLEVEMHGADLTRGFRGIGMDDGSEE